jgi:hypothetical protein
VPAYSCTSQFNSPNKRHQPVIFSVHNAYEANGELPSGNILGEVFKEIENDSKGL